MYTFNNVGSWPTDGNEFLVTRPEHANTNGEVESVYSFNHGEEHYFVTVRPAGEVYVMREAELSRDQHGFLTYAQ